MHNVNVPSPVITRRQALVRGAAGLLSSAGLSAAQAVGYDLSGAWAIEGNGYPGTMQLQHLLNGRMGGWMYHPSNTLEGYWCPASLTVALVRAANGSVGQVFVGDLHPAGYVINGRFYALSAAWGATAIRNVFGFAATRGQVGAPRSTTPPNTPAGVGCLPPHFVVANRPAEYGNNWLINLNFTQSWLSCVRDELTGSIEGDPIFGHYAYHTGSLVFLRMRGGRPFQFYRGQVVPGTLFVPTRISGDFFALTDEAGASMQRIAFDWATV